MADKQVVITLHPLFKPDQFPFRSLTLSTDCKYVDIGRSSKREAKNLVPAHHNAWFDSRVMSRKHARLGTSANMEFVYIRDYESMHGTYLNDMKIASGLDVPLASGDVLTFGTVVTRGADTFEPLKVRCECQWFKDSDPRQDGPLIKKAMNSFSVPDDDSDSDSEIMDIESTSVRAKSIGIDVFQIEKSSFPTDLEYHDPLDQTSPATSLPNQDAADVGEAPTGSSKGMFNEVPQASSTHGQEQITDAEGSQKSPIVVDGDQPLVTPRSTPPTNSAEAQTPDEQVSIADSEDDSQDEGDYIIWCPPLSDDDAESMASSSPSEVAAYPPPCVEPYSDVENESNYSHDSNGGSEHSIKDHSAYLKAGEELKDSSTNAIEPTVQVAQSQAPVFWPVPGYKPDLSQPPCERPVEPPVPGASSIGHFKTALEEWAPHPQSAVPYETTFPPRQNPVPTYHDGPFVVSGLSAPNMTCTAGPSSIGDPWAGDLTKHTQRYACVRNSMPCLSTFISPTHSHDTTTPRDNNASLPSVQAPKVHTRVSIADILDATDPEHTDPPRVTLKRKAPEMEMDSIISAPIESQVHSAPDNAMSMSQDAQPQNISGPVDLSQLSAISSTGDKPSANEEAEASQPPVSPLSRSEEPLRKKARVENEAPHARGYISHAATALVGAVVGGLGTIALLASLPPDFFN
ncbi:hypothetical protein ASPZODRAFT_141014 [Penicilliopsis zonata CBS 506.65]|uniref:FHA domain-containing protein n=1 Tax=Penicilliopsis zonata CBS 506.65 TaxID=1073090 RepID=A0A1L9SNQ5_9EURO|nr:hypothetical protein ASPZODRAFT_141014 [Penicilliopsis zonata CBS 506.65]OJJ48756.1 hypothetical protein ASPZODRAFT_141014 [Penicilliopsis zonata CBS 506.65]